MEIINVPIRKSALMLSGSSTVISGQSLSGISDIPSVPNIRGDFIDITGRIRKIEILERRIANRLKWVALSDQRLRVFYVSQCEKIAGFDRRYTKMVIWRQIKPFSRWSRLTKWRRIVRGEKLQDLRNQANSLREQVENEISGEIIDKWKDLLLVQRASLKGDVLDYVVKRRILRDSFVVWADQAMELVELRENVRQSWVKLSRGLLSNFFYARLDRKWNKMINVNRWEVLAQGLLEEEIERQEQRETVRGKWFDIVDAYVANMRRKRLMFSSNRFHRRWHWMVWSERQLKDYKRSLLVEQAQKIWRARKMRSMVFDFVRMARMNDIESKFEVLKERMVEKQSKAIAKRLIRVWKENAEIQRYCGDLVYDIFRDGYREYWVTVKDQCAAKIQRVFRQFLERRKEQRKGLVKFIWAWRGVTARMMRRIVTIPMLAIHVELPVTFELDRVTSLGKTQMENLCVLHNVCSHKQRVINMEIQDAVLRAANNISLCATIPETSMAAMDEFGRSESTQKRIDRLVYHETRSFRVPIDVDFASSLKQIAKQDEIRFVQRIEEPDLISDVIFDIANDVELAFTSLIEFVDVRKLADGLGQSVCPDYREKDVENITTRYTADKRRTLTYEKVIPKHQMRLKYLEFPVSLLKPSFLENMRQAIGHEIVLEGRRLMDAHLQVYTLMMISCIENPKARVPSEDVVRVVQNYLKLDVTECDFSNADLLNVFEFYEKDINFEDVPDDITRTISFERAYKSVSSKVGVTIGSIVPWPEIPDHDVASIYEDRCAQIQNSAINYCASGILIDSLHAIEPLLCPPGDDVNEDFAVPVRLTIPNLVAGMHTVLEECTESKLDVTVSECILSDIAADIDLTFDISNELVVPFNMLTYQDECLEELLDSVKDYCMISEFHIPGEAIRNDAHRFFFVPESPNNPIEYDFNNLYQDLRLGFAEQKGDHISSVVCFAHCLKKLILFPLPDTIADEEAPEITIGLSILSALPHEYKNVLEDCRPVQQVDTETEFEMPIEYQIAAQWVTPTMLALASISSCCRDEQRELPDVEQVLMKQNLSIIVPTNNNRCLVEYDRGNVDEVDRFEEVALDLPVGDFIRMLSSIEVDKLMSFEICKNMQTDTEAITECVSICNKRATEALSVDSFDVGFSKRMGALEMIPLDGLQEADETEECEVYEMNLRIILPHCEASERLAGCHVDRCISEVDENPPCSLDLCDYPTFDALFARRHELVALECAQPVGLPRQQVDIHDAGSCHIFVDESVTDNSFVATTFEYLNDLIDVHTSSMVAPSQEFEPNDINVTFDELVLRCVSQTGNCLPTLQLNFLPVVNSSGSDESILGSSLAVNTGSYSIISIIKQAMVATTLSSFECRGHEETERELVLEPLADVTMDPLVQITADCLAIGTLRSYQNDRNISKDQETTGPSVDLEFGELVRCYLSKELQPTNYFTSPGRLKCAPCDIDWILQARKSNSCLTIDTQCINNNLKFLQEARAITKPATICSNIMVSDNLKIVVPQAESLVHLGSFSELLFDSPTEHVSIGSSEVEMMNVDLKLDSLDSMIKEQPLIHFFVSGAPLLDVDEKLIPLQDLISLNCGIGLSIPQLSLTCWVQIPNYQTPTCEMEYDKSFEYDNIFENTNFADIRKLEQFHFEDLKSVEQSNCEREAPNEILLSFNSFGDNIKEVIEYFHNFYHTPSEKPARQPRSNEVKDENVRDTMKYPAPSLNIFLPFTKYSLDSLQQQQIPPTPSLEILQSCDLSFETTRIENIKDTCYCLCNTKPIVHELTAEIPMPNCSPNLQLPTLALPHIQIHRDFDLEESRTDVSGLLAISLSIGGLPLPNLAPLLSFESAVPSEPTLEIDISDYLDKTLQSIIAMPTVNFGTTIGNLEDLSDITESISYAMSFLLVDVCETLVQFDDKLQWIQQTANRSHSYVLPDVISHYLDDLVTGLCSTSSNNIANIDIGRAATFEVTYGSSFVQVINLLTHTTPVKSPPRERVMRTDFLLPSEIFDMLDFELTSICGQIRLDNATTVQHRIYSTKHKRRHHVITGVTSNILDTLLVSTLRETIQSDIATVVATHIKRKHKHTAPIYPRDDTRPRVTFILPPDYDDDY